MVASYGLNRRVEPVKNCRNIGKKDMKYNDEMPVMKVDPERYVSISNPQKPSGQGTNITFRLSRLMENYVPRSRQSRCL
jgi:urease alpha subunit